MPPNQRESKELRRAEHGVPAVALNALANSPQLTCSSIVAPFASSSCTPGVQSIAAASISACAKQAAAA